MKLKRFLILYVVPLLVVLLSLAAAIPIYNLSSNLVTHRSSSIHPMIPPVGLATINVTFSKIDLKDQLYSLTFDLKANTNQTAYVLFAFYQKSLGLYSRTEIPMQFDEKAWLKFRTEKFQAFYLSWRHHSKYSSSLETFTHQHFPIDVYETPRVIISFNNSLLLREFSLSSELPTGFVASLIDFRILSPTELPLELIGDPWFSKSLTVSFRVVMVREQNAMRSLLVYTIAPSLCVYWVAAIVQLKGKDFMDRLKIYVGAIFAMFSYILTIRNLAPLGPTYAELLLVSGIVSWGFVESVRLYIET